MIAHKPGRIRAAPLAERIDDTDFVAALLEVMGRSLPKPSGGFQAGVHVGRRPGGRSQPISSFQPARAVAEGAAMLLFLEQKHAIELAFGDV